MLEDGAKCPIVQGIYGKGGDNMKFPKYETSRNSSFCYVIIIATGY